MRGPNAVSQVFTSCPLLDRIWQRSSDWSILCHLGLAPISEQHFEQFEMRGRERGQRARLQDLVDKLQRAFTPLLFGAGLSAFLCERGRSCRQSQSKLRCQRPSPRPSPDYWLQKMELAFVLKASRDLLHEYGAHPAHI